MSVANCTTIVGVFYDRSEADRAIDDLGEAGVRDDQIGIVCHHPHRKTVVENQGEAETHTVSNEGHVYAAFESELADFTFWLAFEDGSWEPSFDAAEELAMAEGQ